MNTHYKKGWRALGSEEEHLKTELNHCGLSFLGFFFFLFLFFSDSYESVPQSHHLALGGYKAGSFKKSISKGLEVGSLDWSLACKYLVKIPVTDSGEWAVDTFLPWWLPALTAIPPQEFSFVFRCSTLEVNPDGINHIIQFLKIVAKYVAVWSLQLCLTLCDPVAPPLSKGFSRQEYWRWLPFPSPGDLPNPGIEPMSPALQVDSLPLSFQGSLRQNIHNIKLYHFNHF